MCESHETIMVTFQEVTNQSIKILYWTSLKIRRSTILLGVEWSLLSSLFPTTFTVCYFSDRWHSKDIMYQNLVRFPFNLLSWGSIIMGILLKVENHKNLGSKSVLKKWDSNFWDPSGMWNLRGGEIWIWTSDIGLPLSKVSRIRKSYVKMLSELRKITHTFVNQIYFIREDPYNLNNVLFICPIFMNFIQLLQIQFKYLKA